MPTGHTRGRRVRPALTCFRIFRQWSSSDRCQGAEGSGLEHQKMPGMRASDGCKRDTGIERD